MSNFYNRYSKNNNRAVQYFIKVILNNDTIKVLSMNKIKIVLIFIQ